MARRSSRTSRSSSAIRRCSALVNVMQFAGHLSDRQAADAVRARIDWTYLLGLELADPGFDPALLSEVRGRLVEHQATSRLFDLVLGRWQALGVIRARGRQRCPRYRHWPPRGP